MYFLPHSDGTAASKGGGGGGFSLEHGLVVAAFACVALVAVTASLGFWKWRKVQRFKVLDNNGELVTCTYYAPLKSLKPFRIQFRI